jgi:hypothetical protein
MAVRLHSFLTYALRDGEWRAPRPSRSTPTYTTPVSIWMGPRAGLNFLKKINSLASARIWTPDSTAFGVVTVPNFHIITSTAIKLKIVPVLY